MRHHPNTARQVALASITEELTDALMRGRRRLHHRAPQDPYVRQLRKDINREHAKPCEMVMRVLLADLEDGAPIDDVLAMPRRLIAILEAHAAPKLAKPIEILLDEVNDAETMVEAPANCAQHTIARDKSPTVLRAALERLLAHRNKLDTLIALLHRALFVKPPTHLQKAG